MEDKVLDILVELCSDDVVREDLNVELFNTGLMDSLAFVELLYKIEEDFGIIISPSEIGRTDMDTPNKIISIIKARG